MDRDDTGDESEDKDDTEEEERKENRPQQRARRATEQSHSEDEEEDDNDSEDDSDEEEQRNGNGTAEREEAREASEDEGEEEEGRRAMLSGTGMVLGKEARNRSSCLTVKLHPPSRGHRDPNAIVPKLEAAISHHRGSPRGGRHDSLLRPPLRNGSSHSATQPPSRSEKTSLTTNPSRKDSMGQGPRNSHSLSSTSKAIRHHVSPRNGTGSSLEKEVWLAVFRYLRQAELCVCMAVCKSWYKW